ncbi:hypothetical protein AC579_3288 [Pseudocercospora musae]|uniref:Uncharacterized protein n=1 Tax=Pseudocercospora musae TaxID=113226 RepID=A0A139ID51_9PEZI|nr:hypothetical protein AC579_3288 [Pseudocercospora musae]
MSKHYTPPIPPLTDFLATPYRNQEHCNMSSNKKWSEKVKSWLRPKPKPEPEPEPTQQRQASNDTEEYLSGNPLYDDEAARARFREIDRMPTQRGPGSRSGWTALGLKRQRSCSK